MIRRQLFATIVALGLATTFVDAAWGIGVRGGGGRGGGMARPAGGMRPGGGAGMGNLGGMPRPNMQRPNFQQPNMPRPNIQRPTGPAFNRPANPGSGRPGAGAGATRPAVGFNRPSGGMKPSTLPGSKPSLAKPAPRPGGKLPDVNLPGGGKPGASKPNVRPSLPDLGINRPAKLPGKLPGNSKPARPKPGDLSDFLGMDRPTTLPGVKPGPSRPGVGKPGIARPERPVGRPAFKPSTPKPGLSDKGWWNNVAGSGNIGSGNLNFGNLNINKRPGWVNIDNSTNIAIGNRWRTAFDRPAWWNRPTGDRWNRWGHDFRNHWGHWGHCHHWYGNDWWFNHRHPICGWHYGRRFYYYSWNYWWATPTWPTVATWFTWSNPPGNVWAQPVYYDYSPGGNVVIQDNSVTIGGERVASTEEFAQSAAELATVEPPKSEKEAEAAEWLPLGTFAVTTNEKDVQSPRSMQLAVSKDGIVSGTYFNSDTDDAQTIQGRVDKNTQRVALRLGDKESIVAETGLYNLTQDESPLLVHFGTEKSETWLLVRLDPPEEAEGAAETK